MPTWVSTSASSSAFSEGQSGRVVSSSERSSLVIAVAIHPVFRNLWAEHAMFTFPELTFVVMGGLVWIGGYIGYRISDLLRFRMLAAAEGANG